MGIFESLGYRSIKEGRKTTGGLKLYGRPKLIDPPRVKYAVFSDERVFDKKKFWRVWKKFEEFLPEGFKFRGGPMNQNAFEFALKSGDLSKDYQGGKILPWNFENELKDGDYSKCVDSDLEIGDVVCYHSYLLSKVSKCVHAGVYFGDGIVRSRWGPLDAEIDSPLVDHLIDEILPFYISYRGALDIPESIGKDVVSYDVFRMAEKSCKGREAYEGQFYGNKCMKIDC